MFTRRLQAVLRPHHAAIPCHMQDLAISSEHVEYGVLCFLDIAQELSSYAVVQVLVGV